VGAVVVKDGVTLGVGWTARGGRPHAEPQALEQAGSDARGATLYVTLEPCAHTGKTPPCTDAIIKACIARVVIACEDPNPQVSGKGIAALAGADIRVEVGVEKHDAARINAGFFSCVKRGRPLISLKTATTLDGKIATRSGHSQWITGALARSVGARLRGEHDAILTGIGTVAADDPQLTCRLPGLHDRSPVRVVLDSALALSPDSVLANTAREVPVWVITREGQHSPALEGKGVRVLHAPASEDGVSLAAVLELLTREGITRLLVEGGHRITTGFFREKLVDRLYWFRGPLLIGADGKGAMGELSVQTLADVHRFERQSAHQLDEDTLEVYTCSPA
jgi:diaminohydroxyphosphoribosylaminopyrimidine deaminase/5-amino-6-(5-phosphoribosylamino)uracil reductase